MFYQSLDIVHTAKSAQGDKRSFQLPSLSPKEESIPNFNHIFNNFAKKKGLNGRKTKKDYSEEKICKLKIQLAMLKVGE
ncbi:hypothetical protein SS50377_20469 [Spironucleus salmonicida]|uniref:Uncharacterized protein n=1 Tax=Spironucleus salmonicida TaxID=348837 RepID=V6LN19_9EUKA|nr:hypothetical protein SS50377_20469 [Spironucleus salmonicida]|eukprot:EST45618.1 Hypothetical protein SS50377_14475 [Spironucleus salmonicida]